MQIILLAVPNRESVRSAVENGGLNGGNLRAVNAPRLIPNSKLDLDYLLMSMKSYWPNRKGNVKSVVL